MILKMKVAAMRFILSGLINLLFVKFSYLKILMKR